MAWEPTTARALPDSTEDDWEPTTARIPVRAHSRKVTPRQIAEAIAAQRGLSPEAVPFAVGQLPTLGGLLGSPAGPVGMTLGTTAGAALRQAVSPALGLSEPRPPIPFGTQSGTMASKVLEVGEQAAMVPLTKVGEKAATVVATGAMRAALRATPEVAKTAIREGIGATARGVGRLRMLLGEVGRKQMAAARNLVNVRWSAPALAEPSRIPAGRGMTGIIERLERELGRSATPSERMAAVNLLRERAGQLLERRVHGIVKRPTMTFTPPQLLQLGQAANAAARGTYNRLGQLEAISPNPDLDLDIANGVRAALRTHPEIRKHTDRLAELNRLREVILGPAEEKGGIAGRVAHAIPRYGTGVAVGGALGGHYGDTWEQRAVAGGAGALAGGLLLTPQALSTLALLLANPSLQQAVSLGTRGAVAEATRGQAGTR